MGNRKRGLRFSLLTSGAKLSTLPTQRSRITSRLRCRDRAQGRSGGSRFALSRSLPQVQGGRWSCGWGLFAPASTRDLRRGTATRASR